MVDKVKQGKKNRASGADFERRTRKDLESKDWIVDKWSNNVEFNKVNPWVDNSIKVVENVTKEESDKILKQEFIESGKLTPAKHKFRGIGIPMSIGTGFPDFICFRHFEYADEPEFRKSFENHCFGVKLPTHISEVIGVECKTNGNLDKTEKEKCRWMLDNNIFGKILIASKTKVKNKIVITYTDFKEKYGDVTTK